MSDINNETYSGSNNSNGERHPLNWKQRAALAVGVVSLAGLATWAVSDGTANYCDYRDRVAPGGQASQSDLCDANNAFRGALESAMGMITDAVTPDVNIVHNPVFDTGVVNG